MSDFDDLRKGYDQGDDFPTWDRDALSKIQNRASFDLDFGRLRGYNGVLVIDIDNFKNINDKYDHIVGDAVIRSIAQNILHVLREDDERPQDEVYRYGGDEMVVVLPNVRNAEDLKKISERIHQAVTNKEIPEVESGYKQGLSIGAAFGEFDGKNNRHFFVKADHANKEAKKAGKNRVVLSED